MQLFSYKRYTSSAFGYADSFGPRFFWIVGIAWAALVSVVLWFPVPAFSNTSDTSSGPWHIVADSLTYDKQNHMYIAEGHVVVSHENESIQADYLEYDRMLDSVFARGNVVLQSRNGWNRRGRPGRNHEAARLDLIVVGHDSGAVLECALCKNDFDAINTLESEFYFMSAMGIDVIPSEATLRQRMDEQAEVFLPIIEKASQDFLKSLRPDLQLLSTVSIRPKTLFSNIIWPFNLITLLIRSDQYAKNISQTHPVNTSAANRPPSTLVVA